MDVPSGVVEVGLDEDVELGPVLDDCAAEGAELEVVLLQAALKP